jgi:hypothetical protein
MSLYEENQIKIINECWDAVDMMDSYLITKEGVVLEMVLYALAYTETRGQWSLPLEELLLFRGGCGEIGPYQLMPAFLIDVERYLVKRNRVAAEVARMLIKYMDEATEPNEKERLKKVLLEHPDGLLLYYTMFAIVYQWLYCHEGQNIIDMAKVHHFGPGGIKPERILEKGYEVPFLEGIEQAKILFRPNTKGIVQWQ